MRSKRFSLKSLFVFIAWVAVLLGWWIDHANMTRRAAEAERAYHDVQRQKPGTFVWMPVSPTGEAAVAALYRQPSGMRAPPYLPGPQIVIAIWGDGRIIWSEDPVLGGAPYRSGKLKTAALKEALDRLEQQGVFRNPMRNYGFVPADGDCHVIAIAERHRRVSASSTISIKTGLPDDPHMAPFWEEIVRELRSLIPDDGRVERDQSFAMRPL